MHQAMKELPLVEDYGDGFCSRLAEWGGMIAQNLNSFTDVRDLQRQLKARGVELQQEANESTSGPASLVAVDPDGNPILVDQHV